MTDLVASERGISFGPFRLVPIQRLLFEDDNPVRVGSRALDILTALVERPGELVGKHELMARAWRDTSSRGAVDRRSGLLKAGASAPAAGSSNQLETAVAIR